MTRNPFRAYFRKQAASQALNALYFYRLGLTDDEVVANAAAILRRAS